ncbi:uncharacterized protein STEHIDRAFT_150404 [Stereum hirsutum FP-91666 SS1]|uniref:uncharacterized protein n=1 Tax=Stereum hirsutum (strain FP-91666) TaxID=721885 RepID=UPI000444A8D4|nr:uncharacterized protein STEHIDRAFT_150404 [Stereum hirsutum FP-91666 SS1]EIM80700.1 hypothetical protein STEHIDRAFT_150404 [Stereum hirsutum FP-91666 SS1]
MAWELEVVGSCRVVYFFFFFSCGCAWTWTLREATTQHGRGIGRANGKRGARQKEPVLVCDGASAALPLLDRGSTAYLVEREISKNGMRSFGSRRSVLARPFALAARATF